MFDHLEFKVVWVGPCCSRVRVLSASDRWVSVMIGFVIRDLCL